MTCLDCQISYDEVIEFNRTPYINSFVFVIKPQSNPTNIKYGIEFCPWKDWVSMYITQDSLDNFTKEDIVAACLHEMTFFGFTDSEVQAEVKKLQDLKDSIEECKNN